MKIMLIRRQRRAAARQNHAETTSFVLSADGGGGRGRAGDRSRRAGGLLDIFYALASEIVGCVPGSVDLAGGPSANKAISAQIYS